MKGILVGVFCVLFMAGGAVVLSASAEPDARICSEQDLERVQDAQENLCLSAYGNAGVTATWLNPADQGQLFVKLRGHRDAAYVEELLIPQSVDAQNPSSSQCWTEFEQDGQFRTAETVAFPETAWSCFSKDDIPALAHAVADLSIPNGVNAPTVVRLNVRLAPGSYDVIVGPQMLRGTDRVAVASCLVTEEVASCDVSVRTLAEVAWFGTSDDLRAPGRWLVFNKGALFVPGA